MPCGTSQHLALCEVFVPFVDTYVKVIDATTKDDLALQAFRWSLSLIAKTLTRNIVEGSTIVMKAINNNSAKQVAKAVCCAPRGERSNWMLLVQVIRKPWVTRLFQPSPLFKLRRRFLGDVACKGSLARWSVALLVWW